jgi:glutamate-1-semialdehyde 2,1-aminomutase
VTVRVGTAAKPVGSPRQAGLIERAERVFPGGVNSPVRAFRSVGRPQLVLERGDGAWVWDADGRRYIDLIGSWGPAILGHAQPDVTAAIAATARQGLAFGATHPLEVELGEAIRAAMPSLERLRFTSSGTEAVMSAVRLARAATGRELIVKFAGAYHGHVDGLLVEGGSGLATHAIPASAGVTAAAAAGTVVLPFNDARAVTAAFEAHPERIAAVIVEPVIANVGVIPPAPGFLGHLRAVTAKDGTLLIFDEVITGFRVARGGAQGIYGVRPDLTTLGKVIGGGMPIGAYGGRADVMKLVAPSGPVYQAGTLSGHPISMAAGLATLRLLTDERYARLESMGRGLQASLEEAIEAAGARASVSRVGSLLTFFFRGTAPKDASEALDGDRGAYSRFFGAMLDQGVLLPPSPFEAWFLSLAHGADEIDAVVAAARRSLASS